MVLASITSSAVLYLCTNSDIGGSSKDGVPECVCVCVCVMNTKRLVIILQEIKVSFIYSGISLLEYQNVLQEYSDYW